MQIGIKGGEYFADALKYNNTISTLDLRANALGDEVRGNALGDEVRASIKPHRVVPVLGLSASK